MFKKYSKIVINEKEYQSLDEVPEHLRSLLKNQIADLMKTPGKTITRSKTFNLSPDKIPEEMRKKILEEMGVGKDGDHDIDFTFQTGKGVSQFSSTPAIVWILAAIAIAAFIYSML